eukprot:9911693-Alexandrium_andersonii.AAC.1
MCKDQAVRSRGSVSPRQTRSRRAPPSSSSAHRSHRAPPGPCGRARTSPLPVAVGRREPPSPPRG